jgi:hypothetical protein
MYVELSRSIVTIYPSCSGINLKQPQQTGTLPDEIRKGAVLKFEEHPYDTFIIETEIKLEFCSGHDRGLIGKDIAIMEL